LLVILWVWYDVTNNVSDAVSYSNISFICVPTPSNEEGDMDLSYIRNAASLVGSAIAEKDDYHVVVVKSTVIPLTTERVLIPILSEKSNKKAGKDFGVCVNPEFLTEINNSWTDDEDYKIDFFNENRIVIGEFDIKSGDMLMELYEPLAFPKFRCDLKTAEYIKYAANNFLAMKISYWNERFIECMELGIDSNYVADVVSIDPRIGKYGTIHGKAFGGKCLPKDLDAFINFIKDFSEPRILNAVKSVNDEMRREKGVRE